MIQNKNLLMLLTVGIYILSLYGVLSGQIIEITLVVSLFFIFFIYKRLLPLKYIVAWLIVFYFGVFNTSIRLKDVDDLLSLAPINSEITGTIISIPKGQSEGKAKFFFDVENIKIGNVVKSLKNEKVFVSIDNTNNFKNIKLYNYGTFVGRLSTPFKAGNPSQFDYGNYLQNHDAHAVFYANEFQVKDKKSDFKANIMKKINNYRENVIKLHSNYLPSPNLEILGGIVFGDDAISPPKEIKQSFINSGLLHILAASGMNVAFIYSFFYLLMSLFKFPFRLKVILGITMIIIYTFMTGLGASIIRASCMLIFVLLGKLINRDAHSISLLSFVGLLMLIYNPLFINDVGFQLSFVVTFGILLMAPAISRFNSNILNYIIATITIPIIAQLWVIPIQIFYFNNISLYSVFANIISVPILSIISFGGFISSLLSAITPLADFICRNFDYILNPLVSLLINISDFWGNLPSSTIQTTHPSIIQIILYYFILLLICCFLYKEIRDKYFKKILVTILTLILVLLITFIPIKNSNLEILVFDVGNADCFLIKTPSNEYIMIDSGKNGYNGGKSQAEIIILKYFKDIGIKSIDTIIVSHFDNDHCGGVVDLLKGVKVSKIIVNDIEHNSIAAKNIYKTAQEENTQIILVENGQKIYNVENLNITNFTGKNSDDDNENSIVSLLEYNNFKMLFTGDISSKELEKLLNRLPKNINILKVPHHGADNGINKKILTYLNPKYSIISVGQNKFGHPSIYTLNLLKNTHILRTDIQNAILIKVKRDYQLYTYSMIKRKFKPYKTKES